MKSLLVKGEIGACVRGRFGLHPVNNFVAESVQKIEAEIEALTCESNKKKEALELIKNEAELGANTSDSNDTTAQSCCKRILDIIKEMEE